MDVVEESPLVPRDVVQDPAALDIEDGLAEDEEESEVATGTPDAKRPRVDGGRPP
jgi:hypothetical protein